MLDPQYATEGWKIEKLILETAKRSEVLKRDSVPETNMRDKIILVSKLQKHSGNI
jgi:hypothetical protein